MKNGKNDNFDARNVSVNSSYYERKRRETGKPPKWKLFYSKVIKITAGLLLVTALGVGINYTKHVDDMAVGYGIECVVNYDGEEIRILKNGLMLDEDNNVIETFKNMNADELYDAAEKQNADKAAADEEYQQQTNQNLKKGN